MVTVNIKGFTEATCSIKVVAGDGAEASVFTYALEGLGALKEQFSDAELIASASAVAESRSGFGTPEDRDNILIGVEREVPINGKLSKGLKLLMTWLDEQQMLDKDLVQEDKLYGEVDLEVASRMTFLAGQAQGKLQNWVDNYNSSRKKALERTQHLFIRT